MKIVKSLSILLLFVTAMNLTSCSGDNEPVDPAAIEDGNTDPTDPTNPDPTAAASFKVDFDGSTYTADATTVYISGGSIILTALKTNGSNFGFILDGTSTGTYAANENLVAYTPAGSEYGFSGFNVDDATEDTGSVTITSINTTAHTISGTFHFKGYWSNTDETVAPKQFTNGVFTNLPYVGSNPTGDTFSATLDGDSFDDIDLFTALLDISGQEFISVAAEDASSNSITVSVRSNLATGEYDITGNVATDVVQINFAPEGADFGTVATSGIVKITEKTTEHLTGTFSGTVVIDGVQHVITAGAFSVGY